MESFNGTIWFSHLPIASQASSTVYAAPAGSAGIPSFRLVALGEQSNVVITSPVSSQILSYNGSNWINTSILASNAAGIVGAGQTGSAAWTLVSGSRYTASFAHGLGTTNVVVTVYDTSNNQVVLPDSVVTTDANTVTVVVVGNNKTLKVVVVANGTSIVAGGSTPSSIVTAYQGVTVSTAATKLNFVGATTVSDSGGGTTTVSIGARFSFPATSLDTPNNADWTVNAFAPVVTDPTNNSLNVRQFSSTTEQGIGFQVSIPSGVSQLTLRLRGRAATAPGAVAAVQFKLYSRQIPNNAAVGAWSTGVDTQVNSIPTNSYFQFFTQTSTLTALGLVSGNTYQVEVTRKTTPSSGTQLSGNFLLSEVTLEFA